MREPFAIVGLLLLAGILGVTSAMFVIAAVENYPDPWGFVAGLLIGASIGCGFVAGYRARGLE